MKACREIFKNSEYFMACIGGREWENKEGYVNLDLHLPKGEKGKFLIESCDNDNSKLLEFDATKHIKRLVKKQVTSFNDDNQFTSDDFDL
jgi:hypothetical protein